MSLYVNPLRISLEELALPRFGARDPRRPAVIALEGPNGAGKTTLCRSLCSQLGVDSCLGTDRAWFSEDFKVRMIRDADWYASAMFFLSGCFEQMRVLRGRQDPFVIMDRSLWSTLAVHAAESLERLSDLLEMLKPIAAEVQIPDMTIVLDASFETCQSRIAEKTGSARALDELTATSDFHARERQFYTWLSGQSPTLAFLDVNGRSAEEVAVAGAGLIHGRARC
jgi:thymidylate kinase